MVHCQCLRLRAVREAVSLRSVLARDPLRLDVPTSPPFPRRPFPSVCCKVCLPCLHRSLPPPLPLDRLSPPWSLRVPPASSSSLRFFSVLLRVVPPFLGILPSLSFRSFPPLNPPFFSPPRSSSLWLPCLPFDPSEWAGLFFLSHSMLFRVLLFNLYSPGPVHA